MGLILCAFRTFCFPSQFRNNEGTGWGSLTSLISVEPDRSEVHLTKGELRLRNVKQLVQDHTAGSQTHVFGDTAGQVTKGPGATLLGKYGEILNGQGVSLLL